jgi:hypothetical protein
MWTRRRAAVPAPLVAAIAEALDAVDRAREELSGTAADAGLRDRREAHARLRRAYLDADALLREATRLARTDSYREWSRWRHRLSLLDLARQQHLLAEADDSGVLPVGSVRVLDTGMSGPAIGDLLHGEASPAGTVARYGLDLDATLVALEDPHVLTGSEHGATGPATVVDLPAARPSTAPRADVA